MRQTYRFSRGNCRIAKHLTRFLQDSDPFGKTIVFCVDQEHAENMRAAIARNNPELMRQNPDYVCRVVSDEGDIGRGHLDRFRDVDRATPVIVTTSQMLTTGIDVPTCKNVAIVRNIGSMTEFKQIIGRGSRVRDDYGKLYFNILDYTGAATRLFNDPEFDGDPACVVDVKINDEGESTSVTVAQEKEVPVVEFDGSAEPEYPGPIQLVDPANSPPRKYYIDKQPVEIVGTVVFDLDAEGRRLRSVRLTEYAGSKVRTIWRDADELRDAWTDLDRRSELIAELEKRGIELADLAKAANQPDWAAKEDGITGDDLIRFINQQEATRPDGKKGMGLFEYLRQLRGINGGRDQRDVIANIFRGVVNRMTSGYLLREVINKVNGIHFSSSEEIHTLSHLYESMLKEMRDAAGDSGEFYTPRAVVRFMVAVLNPRLGELILDPACGTGGFLVESYTHLSKQAKTVRDRQILQSESIIGGEAKPLPYLLSQMNLLLHGVEAPSISPTNSLAVPLREIGDRDRVDVILTNPPFGGEEEKGIQGNFPEDMQTSETALLFLQLIMRKLRRTPKPGRAGVVVPNGTLFGDGVSARIKEELLKEFSLHTIVRLPNGVFAPYTGIQTNVLFFERGGPTKEIWYYEQPLPKGRKSYTKTQPLQYEEFADCIAWWKKRVVNDRAWKVLADQVLKYDGVGRLASVNLDVKNPNGQADIEQLPPAQLVDDIIAKERRILDILADIKAELGEGV